MPNRRSPRNVVTLSVRAPALAIATFAALATFCSASSTFAQDPKPMTAASAASPVTELKIVDVTEGTGRVAEKGKAAMVHYTGWLYDDKAADKKGKQFDTSSNRGLPFGFIVGVGRVIKGWDEGLPGMKVGGKRTLIIPAAMAYGDKEVGNGLIPANSPLVFDIELIEIKP
jgi:FKBP-type peptidyl-prolyl cis-trans isomerase FkpA